MACDAPGGTSGERLRVTRSPKVPSPMASGWSRNRGVRGPWNVPFDTDCYACASDPAVAAVPIFERVHVSDHWRVAHAFDSALAGW